ncbi:cellular tumor antigen p53-like [Candoia aspera]|uniref:cellular tumor antigen p53-like n=1 Tax=Candoia aspera TaxID=51853 RepID=UPI002FD7E69B
MGEASVRIPDPSTTSISPSTEEYAGMFGFELGFDGLSRASGAWFSEKLNTVYCRRCIAFPVLMHVSHPLPSGSIIRAMAVFRHPKDAAEVVRCCPLHEQLLRDRGDVAHPEHLIQVEWNNRAQYFSDSETKRCSVTVPFQESRKSSVVWYKYMCSTSCFVGVNRRPISTTITLESPQGLIFGRRCFEVEIYRRGESPSPRIWRPSIPRLEEKIHHLDLEGLLEDLEKQGR